jgi:hypothetical protein
VPRSAAANAESQRPTSAIGVGQRYDKEVCDDLASHTQGLLFRLELGEFTVRLLGLDQAANDSSKRTLRSKVLKMAFQKAEL